MDRIKARVANPDCIQEISPSNCSSCMIDSKEEHAIENVEDS